VRSPAVPLVWEIFRRGRGAVAAIAGATGLSWLIDLAERGGPPGRVPTVHNQLLGLLSFLLLFGMFSYVEPTGDRGMGRFPRRLFTLPVSTLQLVAVPVVAGIVAIELLHLLWMSRLSGPAPGNPLLVAVLLGAFMVFYQAVLWTLERIGPLRLVVLGALGIAFFWIGFLPSMSGGGAAAWHDPSVLGGTIAVLGAVQFLFVWGYVARIRSGAEGSAWGIGAGIRRLADILPRRREAFRSARAAHFWFEWRCSGSGYPALVAGAFVFLVGPLSVLIPGDPASTARVLVGALALPIVLAVPAGLAFSKPLFWSEEMSLPSFVAVRPVSDAELIAIKLRVAAVATIVAWLLVLLFLWAWLSLWANPGSVHQLFARLRAMDDRWLIVAGLALSSAMFLSWRFLVAGLWAGMSGSRALFMSWLVPIGVVIVASTLFDLAVLPGWLGADLGRLTPFLAAGVLAVAAKFWLAARGIRWTSIRSMGWYGVAWVAGVASLIGLGVFVLSSAARGLPDGDVQRLRFAVMLFAVLLMPLARVVWAPRFLGRNRHRR
jgi:hypothetical protein